MRKKIWLLFYYIVAKNLPDSYLPIIGNISNKIRIFTCKRIFKRMGNVSTIQKGIHFGTGENVEIGDYSGIGKNAVIPNNTIIGNYVMIAQDLFIATNNHNFKRCDIPMLFQGYSRQEQTIIEDDVWIGARVIITPGRHISKGVILAAGSVLTKNPGPYQIWGGVPAEFIKCRK